MDNNCFFFKNILYAQRFSWKSLDFSEAKKLREKFTVVTLKRFCMLVCIYWPLGNSESQKKILLQYAFLPLNMKTGFEFNQNKVEFYPSFDTYFTRNNKYWRMKRKKTTTFIVYCNMWKFLYLMQQWLWFSVCGINTICQNPDGYATNNTFAETI